MLPSFLALPPEQLALLRLVAQEASARKMPVYIVGGFVRDLLLGQPGLDFDIVVVGDAISLAQALAKKRGGQVTAHTRFKTATWFLDKLVPVGDAPWTSARGVPPVIDLITARFERYARPAALPDVTPSTIEDDIRRRDFTINTLALRLEGDHFGELYDQVHGASDIERGLVRALHDGSFIDDPTRMFRAVRYEQRYGFQIEPGTLKLIPAALRLVAQLSDERLRHELDLIFNEPHAARMLARLDELGLLKAVAQVLPWGAELRQRLDSTLDAMRFPVWGLGLPVDDVPFRCVVGYSLWLLDLSPAEIDALQARLSFPLAVLDAVHAAAQLRADLPALSGAAPSKWVERLGGIPLPAVYAVYLASRETALETYASRWRHIRPKTDGEALRALEIPPGPAYKKILLRLRAAWLDGEVTSAEQEQELLRALLAT